MATLRPVADTTGRAGSFSCSGTIGGHPAQVRWTNGQLSGPPWALASIRAIAQAFDGSPVGNGTLPPTVHNHLNVGISALRCIQAAFDGAVQVEGTVPGDVGEDVFDE